MVAKKLSDGILLIPYSRFQCFVLWVLSFFAGSYEKCYANEDVYPMLRRMKIYFDKI